jgi:hypothetical protein
MALMIVEEDALRPVACGGPQCQVAINNCKHCSVLPLQQGVTKICRLSLLTNSALVIRVQCGGREGVAGSQPMRTAVHIT